MRTLSTSPSHSVQSPRRPGKGAHGPLTRLQPVAASPPGPAVLGLGGLGVADHRACLPAGLHRTLTRTPVLEGCGHSQPAPCNQLGSTLTAGALSKSAEVRAAWGQGLLTTQQPSLPFPAGAGTQDAKALLTCAPQAGGDKTAGGRGGWMNCSQQEGMVRRGKGQPELLVELSLPPVETEPCFPEVSAMLHITLLIRYFVKSLWIQCPLRPPLCRRLVYLGPHTPLGNRPFKGKGAGEPDSATHLGRPCCLCRMPGLHPVQAQEERAGCTQGRGAQAPPPHVWPSPQRARGLSTPEVHTRRAATQQNSMDST